MKLGQNEMRKILIDFLDNPSSKIIKELAIQRGEVIADVVDINIENRILTGYEIKSDKDNFKRFPKQRYYYDLVFDYNYLVVGKKYKDLVIPPKNWGLIVIEDNFLEVIKEAEINNDKDIKTTMSLLWKNELISLMGINPKARYMNRTQLVDFLTRSMPENILRNFVIETLYLREKWKD